MIRRVPVDRVNPSTLWGYRGNEVAIGFVLEDAEGPLPMDGYPALFQARNPATGALLFEASTGAGTLVRGAAVGELSVVIPREVAVFPEATWGLEVAGDVIVTGRIVLRERVVASVGP